MNLNCDVTAKECHPSFGAKHFATVYEDSIPFH